MEIETLFEVARVCLELTLGVCLKLFCDNGRIAWADVQNDFLFWMPGVERQDGDGLSRQVEAMSASDDAFDVPVAPPAAAAAK